MIYVATVHWRQEAWIDRQLRSISTYAPGAQVWASLDGIDVSHFSKFTKAWSLDAEDLGPGLEPYASTSTDINGDRHGLKLNELARRIAEVANDDDVIVFIDGDALLVSPLAPVIVANENLTAVRRDENDGDFFPHPSLCLTTVGQWKVLHGDWRRGEYLTNAHGRVMTDTGTKLLSQLDDKGWSWTALTRINRQNLHPVWFGLYGTDSLGPVVYHHGAGFRTRVSRADLAESSTTKWYQWRSFEDRQAALDARVQKWMDRDPDNWWRRRLMA